MATRLVRTRIWWGIAGLIWVAAAAAGIVVLMRYDQTPGAAASAPSTWPTASQLGRDASRPTLVMLAHPRCDCTHASLGELAEVLTRARERPRTYILFVLPDGADRDWRQSALWRAAEQIPDVTVVSDEQGREARRFGAFTSGQTLLYDEAGHLVFSGGTTGGRGRAGDNAGRASLLALLNGDPAHKASTSVYGCQLHNDAS